MLVQYLNLLVGFLADHDGVLEAEVQDHLRVDNSVAGLVEGVLDVRVQDVQRLRISSHAHKHKQKNRHDKMRNVEKTPT